MDKTQAEVLRNAAAALRAEAKRKPQYVHAHNLSADHLDAQAAALECALSARSEANGDGHA